MALVIILGIAVALFVLALATKRRFGVLGLAVAGGVLLSQLWTVTLAALLSMQGVPTDPLSRTSAAYLICVLVPPLLLLLGGPTYHSRKGAFVWALIFAVFTTLFVMGPIMRDFEVTGDSNPIIEFMNEWQNALVGLGILLAIGDILLAHRPKLPRKSSSKH